MQNFTRRLRSIALIAFKAVALITIMPVVMAFFSVIHYALGVIVGICVFLIAAYACYKPLPRLMLSHRWINGLLAFTILITTSALISSEIELQELRDNDPQAYLNKIKETDQSKYLTELKELAPDQYDNALAEINQHKEADRLASLKAEKERLAKETVEKEEEFLAQQAQRERDSAERLAELKEKITLADYRELDKDDRAELIEEIINLQEWDISVRHDFYNCMGDFAANKSEDLSFVKVMGWCQDEYERDMTVFQSHFNQLDAKDLSITANIICRYFVKKNLRSPSTADFPFLDYKVLDRGEYRYTVSSYVDSQNGFGATIRSSYICDVTYDGVGDEFLPDSWEVIDIDFY